MLCYGILCYGVLCHDMLCYGMLRGTAWAKTGRELRIPFWLKTVDDNAIGVSSYIIENTTKLLSSDNWRDRVYTRERQLLSTGGDHVKGGVVGDSGATVGAGLG